MNMEPEEFLSPPFLHSPLWSIIRSFSPRRKRRRRRRFFFIFFLLLFSQLWNLRISYSIFFSYFFSLYSSTRRFFFSTRSLSTSYFESLSRSKCVPLIIFGFKYQLGHAEFFSEAVYRTASWRKIDGTVNDIGPLCSNKSEEREGKGERERESRWKIALDREFENRVPSKATLIRLGARSVPISPP